MEIIELWKKVPYVLHTEASNLGRIRRTNPETGKVAYPTGHYDKDGYLHIDVRKEDNKWRDFPVHRLVAMAWIPNPYNKSCVNHKNSKRDDNRVSNLEWVTPKENCLHSYLYGKAKKVKEVPRNTVLTDFQVSQIEKLRTIYTVHQISLLFNIKYSTLKNIIRKKKQSERLDNQQPNLYNSIWKPIDEGGSTTIISSSEITDDGIVSSL